MAELRTATFKIRGASRFETVASRSARVTFGKGDAKLDGGAELGISEALVQVYRSALPDQVTEGARVVLSSGEILELVARWPQGRWTICKCKRVT